MTEYNPLVLDDAYDFEQTEFVVNMSSALTDDEKSCEISFGICDVHTHYCHEERFFDPRDAKDRAVLHALLDQFLDGIKAIPVKV